MYKVLRDRARQARGKRLVERSKIPGNWRYGGREIQRVALEVERIGGDVLRESGLERQHDLSTNECGHVPL